MGTHFIEADKTHSLATFTTTSPSSSSLFRRVKIQVIIHLNPKFQRNIQYGILEELNGLLLKYHKTPIDFHNS
jgi:hypothetical protein